MEFSKNAKNLVLQNNNGTYFIDCEDLLKWLQEETIARIDSLKNNIHPSYVDESRPEATLPGSGVRLPAIREIKIDSAGDFIAFQSLWAAGVFAGANIKLNVPRWKSSYFIYPTQHGLNTTDLKLVSSGTSVANGTYEEIVDTIRFNIPGFWQDEKIGQEQIAREVRQLLKMKQSTQGSSTWDLEFMELIGKVLNITLAAEAVRSYVMLPIGMMVNDLVKFGVIDYASYAGLNLTNKKYAWKGPVIPFYWDSVKEASGLRSAAEYLATDQVTGGNSLGDAERIINNMIEIIAIYFEAYFTHGKGAQGENKKYDVESINSNQSLLDMVRELLWKKYLLNLSIYPGV